MAREKPGRSDRQILRRKSSRQVHEACSAHDNCPDSWWDRVSELPYTGMSLPLNPNDSITDGTEDNTDDSQELVPASTEDEKATEEATESVSKDGGEQVNASGLGAHTFRHLKVRRNREE